MIFDIHIESEKKQSRKGAVYAKVKGYEGVTASEKEEECQGVWGRMNSGKSKE